MCSTLFSFIVIAWTGHAASHAPQKVQNPDFMILLSKSLKAIRLLFFVDKDFPFILYLFSEIKILG
jgi:hypothetical protein